MIPLIAPTPVWKTGDFVESRVELHMTNPAEEVDLTELEVWQLDIEGVDGATVQGKLRRTLVESRLNGDLAPPPKDNVRTDSWTFLPNGAPAFVPKPQTALETRLYRVLTALLPTPPNATGSGGDPAGRASVEWPDGPTANAAALAARLGKRSEGLRAVDISYREETVRINGQTAVDEENGWPLFWNLTLTGLKLEGGDLDVKTTVSLIATKAKIRGKELPVKPAKQF